MIDHRIKLPKQYKLTKKGIRYQIADELGRGANCIVYNASYWDLAGIEHLARIKELYPIFLRIKRNADFSVCCDESHENKFAEAKRKFEEAYIKNVSFRNTYGVVHSTVNATDIFTANGTIYVVTTIDKGEDYSSYQDKNLIETLTHVRTLASVIAKYHKEGYLYLDLVPENVLIIPETAEHIYLFDFDSVCKKNDLQLEKIIGLSVSEGFSAPEQVQGNISKIGIKTDIYAIGALLFYKLFNRKPNFEDGRYSASFDYEEMLFYDDRLRPAFFNCLDQLLHKTLATATTLRWDNLEQVINCLNELIEIADEMREDVEVMIKAVTTN